MLLLAGGMQVSAGVTLPAWGPDGAGTSTPIMCCKATAKAHCSQRSQANDHHAQQESRLLRSDSLESKLGVMGARCALGPSPVKLLIYCQSDLPATRGREH